MARRARLEVNMCSGLTEKVLEKFRRSGIKNTIDFLSTDPEDLSETTGVGYRIIERIRSVIASSSGSSEIDGWSLYRESLHHTTIFSTGFKELDKILGGGLMTEEITEVYGPPGSGKTRLLLSISLYVAVKLKKPVHFLDPSCIISQDLVTEKCLTLFGEQMDQSRLKNLRVSRPVTVWELLSLVEKMGTDVASSDKLNRHNDDRPLLLVIDSIWRYFIPYTGDCHIQAFGLMNHVAKVLGNFTKIHKSSILISNGCKTHKIENSDEDAELTPILGSQWSQVPNTRISLEVEPAGSEKTHRVTMAKSTRLKSSVKLLSL